MESHFPTVSTKRELDSMDSNDSKRHCLPNHVIQAASMAQMHVEWLIGAVSGKEECNNTYTKEEWEAHEMEIAADPLYYKNLKQMLLMSIERLELMKVGCIDEDYFRILDECITQDRYQLSAPVFD